MTDIQRQFTGQSSFMRYASNGERRIARKLVAHILGHDKATISVNDGEEWTVRRSPRIAEVLEALCTTGEDLLRWRDEDGDHVATFHLVWGNDDDGSELIADYTDNDWSQNAYDFVYGRGEHDGD